MDEDFDAADVAIRRLAAVDRAIDTLEHLNTYFNDLPAHEDNVATYAFWRSLIQRIVIELGSDIVGAENLIVFTPDEPPTPVKAA